MEGITARMRYGYWLPIFGGWLRNVEDEAMSPTWEYASKVAMRAEEIGFAPHARLVDFLLTERERG